MGQRYFLNKKDFSYNQIEGIYLDTIGVSKNNRGKKIGTVIKVELINYAFNELKLERIKAIT